MWHPVKRQTKEAVVLLDGTHKNSLYSSSSHIQHHLFYMLNNVLLEV